MASEEPKRSCPHCHLKVVGVEAERDGTGPNPPRRRERIDLRGLSPEERENWLADMKEDRGKRLFRLRRSTELDQEDVAQVLREQGRGATRNYIGAWEINPGRRDRQGERTGESPKRRPAREIEGRDISLMTSTYGHGPGTDEHRSMMDLGLKIELVQLAAGKGYPIKVIEVAGSGDATLVSLLVDYSAGGADERTEEDRINVARVNRLAG